MDLRAGHKRRIRNRKREVARFAANTACLCTLLTGIPLLTSWWLSSRTGLQGFTSSLAMLMFGVLWSAVVSVMSLPLIRPLLWRKSLPLRVTIFSIIGIPIQVAVVIGCVLLAFRGFDWLAWLLLIIGLPLAPVVLPVILISMFRRDVWWEDPACCQSCGYDRRGINAAAVCPECGSPGRAPVQPRG